MSLTAADRKLLEPTLDRVRRLNLPHTLTTALTGMIEWAYETGRQSAAAQAAARITELADENGSLRNQLTQAEDLAAEMQMGPDW